jgi:DNA (cytosine-5)-methyltransferase 1
MEAPPSVFPGVRRLTPRECERLQGFPDDWTAGQSDAQRYRQLGNAVAVPVVEWIGRRIVAVDTALRHMEDRAIA